MAFHKGRKEAPDLHFSYPISDVPRHHGNLGNHASSFYFIKFNTYDLYLNVPDKAIDEGKFETKDKPSIYDEIQWHAVMASTKALVPDKNSPDFILNGAERVLIPGWTRLEAVRHYGSTAAELKSATTRMKNIQLASRAPLKTVPVFFKQSTIKGIAEKMGFQFEDDKSLSSGGQWVCKADADIVFPVFKLSDPKTKKKDADAPLYCPFGVNYWNWTLREFQDPDDTDELDLVEKAWRQYQIDSVAKE